MLAYQLQFCVQTKHLIIMETNKLIDHLNDVLQKNYDAAKGYTEVAEKVKSPSLKKMFFDNAAQRRQFAGTLVSQIRQIGGEPVDEGSVLGSAHRTWINIKTSLSSNTDEAVLEEVITGEEAAVSEYESFLEDRDIPMAVRTMVEAQKVQVGLSLTTARNLESLVD